jgi:DNA-binding GntR family transcriptional regulator
MKRSLSEQIYWQLKDEIMKDELKGNTFVTESELSKRFNISKTPVREALTLLKMEGFVDTLPHKGYLVTSVSAN